MSTTRPHPVTYYLRTYGCQMNERDSEAVACLLEARGFVPVDTEAAADVLLYNTCSVRDQAERKVLGKLGILKKLKREKPHLVIGVLGCMAQRLGEEIPAKLPHVDLVIGTDQLQQVPDLLEDILRRRGRHVSLERGDGGMDFLKGHQAGKISAFVAVMRGCNQYCTYCVVPEVRGREKSRGIADIVEEVRSLAAGGVREIFLLGQNITAYGIAEARKAGTYTPELSPFAELLRAVAAVPGVARIRFTSPHPRYMNAVFVQAVKELPQVCEAFHMPLQSAADRILGLMKRGYTWAEYLDRVQALKAVRPGATFSTDIIIGFPTETEAEFAITRAAMDEVGYDNAYIFKYSPRPGTPSAAMPDDVPQTEKERHLAILLEDLERRTTERNRQYIGKVLEVLVEGPSKLNPQRLTGRSRCSKVCLFEAPASWAPGELLNVRIERCTAHSLYGTVLRQ